MYYIKIFIFIVFLTLKSIATRCCDGSYSSSSGRGTCSHHGGVCNFTNSYISMPTNSFPNDINITCNINSDITLNWEDIPDAYYYRIYYSYEENSSYFNYLDISFYSEYRTDIFETCNIYFKIKSCNNSYSCSDSSSIISPTSNDYAEVADILWQKGEYFSLWYMNENGTHTYKYIGRKDEPYRVVGTNDFNNDGVADILWQKGKYFSLWYMNKNGTHTYKYIGRKEEPYCVVDTNKF